VPPEMMSSFCVTGAPFPRKRDERRCGRGEMGRSDKSPISGKEIEKGTRRLYHRS
jgi:hypothetical protein